MMNLSELMKKSPKIIKKGKMVSEEITPKHSKYMKESHKLEIKSRSLDLATSISEDKEFQSTMKKPKNISRAFKRALIKLNKCLS